MARLDGARLVQVNLYRATFTAADLRGADFTGATFGFTCVSDCNMFVAEGLDKAQHVVPSSIGIDTLTRSIRSNHGRLSKELRKFFRGAGVSRECLNELPRAITTTKYHSCFIAYGSPDQDFAARLNRSLKAKGVDRWFFPKDAIPGQPTLEEERRARRNADRIVAVCSGAGLGQPGLLREIDETMEENLGKLIPVLKDKHWLSDAYQIRRDDRDLKPFLRNQVWADFNSKPYREALSDLLAGLSKG